MFWYPLLNEKTIMIDILNRFSDLSSREYQAVTDLCVFKMLYWWLFHQYRVWKEGANISWEYRYVFSKCYIGGHSTNIGFEKRIQIKLDQ